MNVDDIRTFVAVVEAGSISGASRELHLTQPAVSRRVQRLEDALATQLIDRRRRPLALTDAGRTAVERCRRFLTSVHELKTIADGTMVPSRELRIGVAHALTELALLDPVDAVRRAFPSAILRLRTGWSRDLLARVKTGALDAAVILLPQSEGTPTGVAADALATDELAIVAPRSWARPNTMRQLADEPWILNPEGCAARAALEHELARTGRPLRVGVETYTYELQLRLIARGRGLGLVPRRLLERSPTRAKLRTLAVRGVAFPQVIWMMTGELPADLDGPLAAFRDAFKRAAG